jgi:phage gp45-like
VVVGAESSRYGPSDLKDGEVAVYNKVTGTIVKLDENGAVSITAAVGQLVTINGSDYALPKWDAFMTAFTAFLTTLKTVTNATAAVVASAASTMDGARTGASDWKSTKAKNG